MNTRDPGQPSDGERCPVLLPVETVQQLAAVERAAGLPAGLIASKVLRSLVAEWIRGEPGELARWIEDHFTFEGSPEERALISRELYRLEAQWRIKTEAEESAGTGWS